MATGLALPVGITTYGGAKLVDGEINDNKIISLALGSGWNENAFQQDIALGQDMIFDLNDQAVRAKIKRRLVTIFRDFQAQNRYRLLPGTLKWTEDGANQALELVFKYANLESDETKDFSITFTAAGAQIG